jgi:TPR repeat protein
MEDPFKLYVPNKDVERAAYHSLSTNELVQKGEKDAEALLELAMRFSFGVGVPQSNQKSMEYVTSAALLGHPVAVAYRWTSSLDIYTAGPDLEYGLERAKSVTEESASRGNSHGISRFVFSLLSQKHCLNWGGFMHQLALMKGHTSFLLLLPKGGIPLLCIAAGAY